MARNSRSPPPAAAEPHRAAQSESHNHSGPVVFGASAAFRAANQATADLARVLSDQIGLPVADDTGLPGKYDISLRWSVDAAATRHTPPITPITQATMARPATRPVPPSSTPSSSNSA